VRWCFRIAVAVFISGVAAFAGWRPMPRLALVHDNAGAEALYNYFAAAPAFVFRYGGDVYQAPVLADAVANDTVKLFFETYKKYLDGRGGLKQLVAVGGVAPSDLEYARK